MTKKGPIIQYMDGERICPVCKEASLPAHEAWPGARYLTCDKPTCMSKAAKAYRFVGCGERKCESPVCGNFIPAGKYHVRVKFFSCSAKCWTLRKPKGSILMTCACGCGIQFLRASHRPSKSGLAFFSPRHMGDYVIEKYLQQSCGPFRSIADEYFNGVATVRYADLHGVRRGLATLFQFLNERGATTLEDVSPQVITEYIMWMDPTRGKAATSTLPYISSFFGWMIDEGRRKTANPVTRLHRPPKVKRKARPLQKDELEMLWRLLCERGDPRVRLAAALGLEGGLRISEICRLRISDVDLERQQLQVRLPNKGMRERPAFFANKTLQYWNEWMSERNPNCGHDHVLYNDIGTPYSRGSLANAFKRVLLKTFKGEQIHDTGLDDWSTHRLRHTMASSLAAAGADLATLMAAGGWLDPDSMAGYVEVPDELARRGYDEAMRKHNEQKELVPQTRTVSAEELLAILAEEEGTDDSLRIEAERCV